MPRAASSPSGQIRIIGGRWKRTSIAVRHAPGLRPTPDRVRETLFNWLGQRLDGWRCLDLFAGSGALGLEAASRGAAEVVLVESDAVAARAIEALLRRLGADAGVQVRCAMAQSWLARQGPAVEPFDLIFLDPPFGRDLADSVMPACVRLLAPDGLIYLESEVACTADWAARYGLSVIRADKAGMVHYHLLHRSAVQGEQDVDSGVPGDIRSPDAGP